MKISNETRFFNQIMIRIVLIFGTALIYSLIMEWLEVKNLLDNVCDIYEVKECCGYNNYPQGFKHTHWSSNHYIYFFMNLSLMVLQVVRLIHFISENVATNGKIIYKKQV